MARQHELYFSLNRGEVSDLLLARTDLQSLRMAARLMVNWLPRVLGPMMLRPGTQFIGEINADLPAKIIPFVAGFDDTAVIELTDGQMRAWVNDALVTRAAVTTTIPDFTAWTLAKTGTTIAQVTLGVLQFSNVNSGASGSATAAVAVAAGDRLTEHGVRIVVANGPMTFRIGSSAGADDIFETEILDTGTYSLAFTPGNGIGTVYLQFDTIIVAENANTLTSTIPQGLQQVSVASCAIEAAGVMILPTPWPQSVIAGVEANVVTEPSSIRYTESADVVFLAAKGLPQYQINRYSPTSWSIVNYRPVKGPMNAARGDPSVLLTPSATSGNITLSANKGVFKPADVGTLFRLFHNGQIITRNLSFPDTFTDAIRVTGVSIASNVSGGTVVNTATEDRNFNYTETGSWDGSLALERSFEGPTTGFTIYATNSAPVVSSVSDGLNNIIVWYRIRMQENHTTGTAAANLTYPGGGGAGVAHITGYVNSATVSAEVLVPFYNTTIATDWRQSQWSASQGYPTSVELDSGRLWWAGADRWWGSISDDYNNFDYDAIGDAAPVNESIGKGPIANMNWLLSLDHLLGGADTSIILARSDAIDSTLTSTTFNLRTATTNGSYPIQAVRVDSRAIYIDKSGRRIYELIYDIQNYNYKSSDLTRLNPDIGLFGFLDMTVQRQPDTRINIVRKDGQMVSLLYDVQDNVTAFWRMQTDGIIENVITLPGAIEDQTYFVIKRTINGVAKRYLEKWARIDECQGGLVTKCADSHKVYQGAPVASLPGFVPHLAGKTAVIWADGRDLGTCLINNAGDVAWTGGGSYQNVVVGLGYEAQWLSGKLAYAAQQGSAINQYKQVDHIGFVLANTHCQAIKFGSYETNPLVENPLFPLENVMWDEGKPLDSLPMVERGAVVDPDTIWADYDERVMEFPGEDRPDARIYIQGSAPRPATVLAITFDQETEG